MTLLDQLSARLFCIFALLLAGVPAFAVPDLVRTLYPTGGGIQAQEAYQLAVARARIAAEVKYGRPVLARELKVTFVGYASTLPEKRRDKALEQLKVEDADQHVTSLLRPPEANEIIAHADAISGADLIVMCGGSQSRLMEAVSPPKILAALRTAYFKYFSPWIVSSASTAFLTKIMLTGYSTDPGTGIALIDEVVIDQHFFLRGREYRLIKAMILTGAKKALVLDEDATVEIQNEREVRGLGKEKFGFYDLTSGHLVVSVLEEGDFLDLKTGKIKRAPWNCKNSYEIQTNDEE